MPSPETDPPDAQDASHEPPVSSTRANVLRGALAVAILLPIVFTAIGAVTSPPHAARLPIGKIVYMVADQPSEHTSTLRGLFCLGRDGSPRLIVHEYENQDQDTGQREWINQPSISPDGRSVAYVKQSITLLEEKQQVINQIWVASLPPAASAPRLLFDLTARKLKPIVGVAWTPDSRDVVFLNDAQEWVVPVGAPATARALRLQEAAPILATPGVSATRDPTLIAASLPGVPPLPAPAAFVAHLACGMQLRVGGLAITDVRAYALSDDGRELAYIDSGSSHAIHRISVIDGSKLPDLTARWGWSIFGGRRITSLRWSPDGAGLAYTVSKPPADDELFYVDVATGRDYELPVRTGKAAWDWARA